MFTIIYTAKTETLCVVIEGDFYSALLVAIKMIAAAREPLTSLFILPGANTKPAEAAQALTQAAADLQRRIETAEIIQKGSPEGN